MSAIITEKFRRHNARNFFESFSEASADVYYLFLGKATPFTTGTTGGSDTSPSTPADSVSREFYNWDSMLGAKKITSSDVSHVVPRKNWTNNTSYFAYTHNTATLYSQDFYVMTDDYNVYKCLSNSETNSTGSVATTSTTKPTGTGTSIIATADGYKWKFMYQISASDALKFVTPNYIPVDTVRRLLECNLV